MTATDRHMGCGPNRTCHLACDCREAEFAALRAEVERLREALMLCDRFCEHLDHSKADHHSVGAPCPVEARVHAALAPKVKP